MTENAFHNAILVDMALGGSSNTVLHLTRIAKEIGIDIPIKLFNQISSKIPHIVDLRPSGRHFLEDLEYAGGVSAVLNVLKSNLKPSPTINGKNIIEIAKEAFPQAKIIVGGIYPTLCEDLARETLKKADLIVKSNEMVRMP